MGSDDERHQRLSQYSLHRSRHRSPSQDTYANPSGPSRSRSHRRSDILPPRPHAPEDPSRLSGRLAAPNYPYPPSVFSEGHVPRRSPIRYSMAGKTQHELDEEDAAMRKEDRVNRKSRKEATGNKVFAEERSRSRRRSDRAFSNSRQFSGEGRYSGDERDYHVPKRRGSPLPQTSGSGYPPRHSRRESEAQSSDHDPYNRPPSSDRRRERHTGQSRDDRTNERPRQRSRTGDRPRERSRTRSRSLASMFRSLKEYTRRS